jgi:hypothetical protein
MESCYRKANIDNPCLIWMHIAVVVIDFIKRPAFTGEIA